MGEMGGGAERKTEMRELSRSAEENDDSEVRDDGDAQRRLREGAVRFELVDDGDRARGETNAFFSLFLNVAPPLLPYVQNLIQKGEAW